MCFNRLKGMLSTLFSRQIPLGPENGFELDDIEANYRVSFLKPLHTKWLVELYNRMCINERKKIVGNGWKKSGHLRRSQTLFKRSSIFGSIWRYMLSD